VSNLESSKNMAGIGSILLVFPVVSIIGMILILVGMKGLADYYKDESIYKNAIWGVIFGIIAVIAIAVAIPIVILGGVFSSFALGAAGIGFGLLSLALIIVIVFVFYLIAAMYFRKAFNSLAQRSGEHMFETAGTLLFIGAILTIAFGLGLLLILIAWILATIAFFSIKVPSQPYAYIPPPSAAPPTQPTRYCPNCGAPVEPNATFCPHCGNQLPPA
jgi:uncharacterized membrane protein